MAGDDDVGAFVRLHRVFGVADKKADIAPAGFRLRPCKLQHGFRPIHAGDLKTEIVHQVRDNAGAAGQIQRLAAFSLAQMLQNQRVPGLALFFGENLMTRGKVESRGAAGPIVFYFVSQTVVFAILDSVDHRSSAHIPVS
ncbi:hypothetical protein D3C72_2074250 [compost metagenome]